jgi:Fanconi anemia group M protein
LKELVDSNALETDDPSKNSTFGLMNSRIQFHDNTHNVSDSVRKQLMPTFLTYEALSGANDILNNHGVTPFVDSIEGIIKRTNGKLTKGKDPTSVNRTMIENPDLQCLISTIQQEMENPHFQGHPTMEQLVTLLLHHFAYAEEHLKVAIISNSDKTVDEIYKALEAHYTKIQCRQALKDYPLGMCPIMFTGNRGYGIGSPIKGHLKYGGTWKPYNYSYYTPVVITNEHNTSQNCPFCFQKLAYPYK